MRQAVVHIDYEVLAKALGFPDDVEIVLMVPMYGMEIHNRRATMLVAGPQFPEPNGPSEPTKTFTAVYESDSERFGRFLRFEQENQDERESTVPSLLAD